MLKNSLIDKLRILAVLLLFLSLNLHGQFTYISPLPGSSMHHPETTVLVRTGDKIDIQNIEPDGISIEGSKSGIHNFRIVLSDDNRTLILIPDIIFLHGEKVTVSVNHQSGLLSEDYTGVFSFDFYITGKDLRTIAPNPILYNTAKPPRAFPVMDITMAGNYYDEPLFFYIITALASNHDRYMTIIEPDGSIIYAQQRDNEGLNFILQESGYLSYFSIGKFMIMDSLYHVVDSFKCGNGYFTDWHEFQYLENGHALLLSYDNQSVDMSQIVTGGDTNAIVEGLVVQEIDTNKNVVFQWRSWDHFEITDATHIDFLDSYFSYVHGNALELSNDSNILLSSRLLDEITKIDMSTGDIIWRWGGKNNEFTFVNDTGMFSRQHDIRQHPDGHYSMLDNGEFHPVKISTAKEYILDEVNMTAELVWSFHHPDSVYTNYMGNVQVLPNGNRLINWSGISGYLPHFTEVTYNKEIVYELSILNTNNFIYRCCKAPWTTGNQICKQIRKEGSLHCFPNPGKNSFTISFLSESIGSFYLTIFDMQGKTVHKEELQTGNREYQFFKVNTMHLQTGIYNIMLETDKKILHGKWVKID